MTTLTFTEFKPLITADLSNCVCLNLKFRLCNGTTQILTKILGRYPNVKSLKILELSATYVDFQSSSLTTLRIGSDLIYSGRYYRFLPLTLKSLSIGLSPKTDQLNYSLPAPLEYLEFYGGDPDTLPFEFLAKLSKLVGLFIHTPMTKIPPLPSTLKHLHINLQKQLSLAPLQSLNLKSLTLDSPAKIWTIVEDIPKTLTKLVVNFWLEYQPNLPPKLTHLTIRIKKFDLYSEALPQTLRVLDYSGTNTFIINLPQQLKRLTFRTCHFQDQHLLHIPNSVEELNLLNLMRLTENLVHYLPKHLKVLRFNQEEALLKITHKVREMCAKNINYRANLTIEPYLE